MENNQKDQERKKADDTKPGKENAAGAQIPEQKDDNQVNTNDPIEPTTPSERSRHFNETHNRENAQDNSTIPGATPIERDKPVD